MTDGRKICGLWIILMLIAICASNERVLNGEDAKVNPKDSKSERPRTLDESSRIAELIKRIDLVENPTNATSKESYPFEESILFADLITRADLAFEANEPNSFTLMRPKYVFRMPISELDSMLGQPGLRKELAVVVIGEWSGPVDGREWKIPEQFASEVNHKLRKAGFKHVIFASKDHGLYQRTSVGSLWDCDSNRVAELISAINSTNTSFYAQFDFGESDVLGWLFRCADLAFKADGEVIQLVQPEPLGLIPTSELDRILVKPGLRKELAVVFIEHFRPIDFRRGHDVKAKESEEGEVSAVDRGHEVPPNCESELDEKLRGAGFKQVVFAHKNNHGFRERMWVPTKYPK